MDEGEGDLAGRVCSVLSVEPGAFQTAVDEDATRLREAIESGVFDNLQSTIGLEYELYGADAEGRLARVPRRVLGLTGVEKELGLHNVELNTSPQPLSADGLAAQEAELRARLDAVQRELAADGLRLVSDALWTIPPDGESAIEYLTDSEVQTVTGALGERSVRLASNMSDDARYHAMANSSQAQAAAMCLSAPNVSLEAQTVLPESLISSIQPHYQLRRSADLPRTFAYAIRIAAPLLALGANAPFFPPECYDDDAPPEQILSDAWMDHRIGVFESVLNAPDGSIEKVRFPRDIQSVTEAVERIAADTTIVPMPVEEGTTYDDHFAHFCCKHGTYWRWIRPVFDGPTRAAASTRIEFRPISSQPTVADSMAFLAAVAGLLERLPLVGHPVADLEWEVARENFYAAARDGIDADLRWIATDGEETRDVETVYGDLLDHAEAGLVRRGLSTDEARSYLFPLRHRVRHRVTPADWKRRIVEAELEAGGSLEEAIHTMQRRYIDRQSETLLEGRFADWPLTEHVQVGKN